MLIYNVAPRLFRDCRIEAGSIACLPAKPSTTQRLSVSVNKNTKYKPDGRGELLSGG